MSRSDKEEGKFCSPCELRDAIRSGKWCGPTSGECDGYLQLNLVMLPAEYAADFARFCRENARACPLLYQSAPGETGAPPLSPPTPSSLSSSCISGASSAGHATFESITSTTTTTTTTTTVTTTPPLPTSVTAAAATATNGDTIPQPFDVRTDLPLYRVWRHGKLVESATDLLKVWRADLVSFYLGCSFTFESALTAAGVPVRNVQQGCNVPMYKTNRQCVPVGPFSGPLVVSMRPMPLCEAKRAVGVTGTDQPALCRAHGPPIHWGPASDLGIANLGKPDFGDAVCLEPDDVPVFWACGVTSSTAATSSTSVPLCITHAPGHMYVCDRRVDELALVPSPYAPHLDANVVAIEALDRIAARDPGKRGISRLHLPNEIFRAARRLAERDCRHVGITTGFPCNLDLPVSTETDGPPGAVALGRALLLAAAADDAPGGPRRVSFIVDEANRIVLEAALAAAANYDCPALADAAVLVYSPSSTEGEGEGEGEEKERSAGGAYAREFLKAHAFDALVAVERAARAADGHYYTMRARLMDKLCAPIDDLFEAAAASSSAPAASNAASASFASESVCSHTLSSRPVFTVGIGDGGNELGMGRVAHQVKTGIPRGDVIAAATSADALIVAGVSNWGAYALAAATAILMTTTETAAAAAAAAAENEIYGNDSNGSSSASGGSNGGGGGGGGGSRSSNGNVARDLAARALVSSEWEAHVVGAMVAVGARDGVNPDGPELKSVDGMELTKDHASVLSDMAKVLQALGPIEP